MGEFAGQASDHFQRYGEDILDDVEPGSLLISATDINWNSVRYLQTCEGARPDVVHISLQITPFPWFQFQHDLYPGVFCVSFLSANAAQTCDGIFYDLIDQAQRGNIKLYKGDR